jgi:hypothetical protein
VREFDHFGDCFCTCALIIWTVLLQPLPVDDDPYEVDWLEIEDESEQASQLA